MQFKQIFQNLVTSLNMLQQKRINKQFNLSD